EDFRRCRAQSEFFASVVYEVSRESTNLITGLQILRQSPGENGQGVGIVNGQLSTIESSNANIVGSSYDSRRPRICRTRSGEVYRADARFIKQRVEIGDIGRMSRHHFFKRLLSFKKVPLDRRNAVNLQQSADPIEDLLRAGKMT